MMLPKKIKLSLIAFIIFGTTLLSVVNFTDYFALEVVSVNASVLDNWSDKYSLDANKPITRQPLDSLASLLIKKNHIYKVDINYALPNKIEIKTNNYKPVCFVLDRITKKVYGLDSDSRVVLLKYSDYTWDNPILTSLTITKPFGYCMDYRVKDVVQAIQKLKKQNRDLYCLIDEIDFGNTGFLKVSIDGLPYRLKVRYNYLREDMDKFIRFVSRFDPNLENIALLDLRYDEMIVCSQGKK